LAQTFYEKRGCQINECHGAGDTAQTFYENAGDAGASEKRLIAGPETFCEPKIRTPETRNPELEILAPKPEIRTPDIEL
jgi:hypothetical protein